MAIRFFRRIVIVKPGIMETCQAFRTGRVFKAMRSSTTPRPIETSNNLRPYERKSGHGGCAVPVLVALALIVGLFLLALHNSGQQIRVAQVCAIATQTSIPSMDVLWTFYDKDGHVISTQLARPVPGNKVKLQSDVIPYGLGVSYRLTGLQGYYDDPRLEQRYAPAPISLSKGEDNLYSLISKIPMVTPHSSAVFLKADGHRYDIYVTANGLSASPVKGPLACGLNHQAAV